MTEALVAEGLSAEVAAREGGIDEDALVTINTQFDALVFLAESARVGRPLTSSFIRELHVALCRNQKTYAANTQFGDVIQRPLRHGDWKEQANHVYRQDGTLLEYVPPDHVGSEIDRMVTFDAGAGSLHPVARAAWLHHAFVAIHPFEDGNGRVARALTLLILLQSDYAPLVVDRLSRTDYLDAVDAANMRDLRPLVRLFARLETVALRSELERPAHASATNTGAIDVARGYAERLIGLRKQASEELTQGAHRAAEALNVRVQAYLQELGAGVVEQFQQLDASVDHTVFAAAPPDERAFWWRTQTIRAANEADFFVNLNQGTWWSLLRLRLLGEVLRFGVVTQKVGHGETGVLAVTVFAESVPVVAQTETDSRPQFTVLLKLTPADSATIVYSDDLDSRWQEVCSLIDKTLGATIAAFAERLS